MNLTDTQLLFLDNLIYLNNINFEKKTVGEIINTALLDIENCTKKDPAEITKEEWVDLLESFTYEKDENGNYKTDSNGNKVIKEENRYFLEN